MGWKRLLPTELFPHTDVILPRNGISNIFSRPYIGINSLSLSLPHYFFPAGNVWPYLTEPSWYGMESILSPFDNTFCVSRTVAFFIPLYACFFSLTFCKKIIVFVLLLIILSRCVIAITGKRWVNPTVPSRFTQRRWSITMAFLTNSSICLA